MKINHGYNKLTYHYFSVVPLSHFLNNNIIIITYILFFPWTIIAYKEKLLSEPEGRAALMIVHLLEYNYVLSVAVRRVSAQEAILTAGVLNAVSV